jgi:hypothetical protein
MSWNFALSHEHQLEALLLAATFSDVHVSRESRQISFDSLEDYWAAMEGGGGLSGATYLALSPDDRHAVREEVNRGLLPSGTDGPFTVEFEVMFGSGQR